MTFENIKPHESYYIHPLTEKKEVQGIALKCVDRKIVKCGKS